VPELADQPAKSHRTWRPMALWSAAILLVLGLAWLVGAVVVPYFQVRALLRSGSCDTTSLGQPHEAARKVGVYLAFSRLSGEDYRYRFSACPMLRDLDEEGAKVLMATLKDSDARVRSEAATELAIMGPTARMAVRALIQALKDSDSKVRESAALALGKIGPEACVAIPDLCEALRDADARTRSSAAYAMSFYGPLARPAIPVLTAALEDQDFRVRYGAAWTLGAIGSDAHVSVPALVAKLEDSSPIVKITAAYALCRIEPARTEKTVELLIDALLDPDEHVYDWAAELLGNIGPPARSASEPLSRLQQSTDSVTRQIATEALKKIRGEGAKP
jgi:HEAT repeat protein